MRLPHAAFKPCAYLSLLFAVLLLLVAIVLSAVDDGVASENDRAKGLYLAHWILAVMVGIICLINALLAVVSAHTPNKVGASTAKVHLGLSVFLLLLLLPGLIFVTAFRVDEEGKIARRAKELYDQLSDSAQTQTLLFQSNPDLVRDGEELVWNQLLVHAGRAGNEAARVRLHRVLGALLIALSLLSALSTLVGLCFARVCCACRCGEAEPAKEDVYGAVRRPWPPRTVYVR